MPGFFLIDGVTHAVGLTPAALGVADDTIVAIADDRVWVHFEGAAWQLEWQSGLTHHGQAAAASGEDIARAPMPGMVIAVLVAAGDAVSAGDTLMLIESMKLETAITAWRGGHVEMVHRSVGQTFERDSPLVALMPASDT